MVQQMADSGIPTTAHLFSVPPVDELDELGERLERAFNLVTSIQNGSSQKEGRDKLSQVASQNIEKYVDLMDGLLYGILTDPLSAERFLGDITVLSMLNAEAFGPLVKSLNSLVHEKFSKLSDVAKKQSVWLIKDMTKKGIGNLDRVHIPFMRNLTSGDHWKNIPLLESYMEVFTENRPFFELPASAPIVQMAILTFIQLIQYHGPLQYSVIKDKELDFCLDLLRLRFTEFAGGGRELTRSLMAVCKMPKMKEFWNDFVNNPKNLPIYTGGLPELLKAKTPKWIYAHKISAELEAKVGFLLTKVRAPLQTRYCDIFVKQYLSTPDCDILLPELIRFVIRVVHPSNEILGSDVLQRWNFILILLTNCKTAHGLNNCMLALFYDWLLFDGLEPNIMNIEPAILLLMNLRLNTVRVLQKPLLHTLIDYLCKIPFEFFPPIQAKTRKSVVDSFVQVLEKRVIGSLAPIHDAVTEELRGALRKAFPEIFALEDPTGPRLVDRTNTTGANGNGNGKPGQHPGQKSALSVAEVPMEPGFSDTEEEIPFVPSPKATPEKAVRQLSRPHLKKSAPRREPSLAQSIDQLPNSLQPLLVRMRDGDDEDKCSAMEDFVVDVINEGFLIYVVFYLHGMNIDLDDCEHLARTLAMSIKPIYDNFKLPETLTDETFEDSVQSPLFILFRRLWEEIVESPPRQRVLALLSDMTFFMPDIPFLLVYFMIYKESKQPSNDDRDVMADFEDLCFAVRRKTHQDEQLDEKSYEEYIAACLDRCGHHDHRMLVSQAEFFYRETPKVSKDSPLVAHAVVSHIDAWELRSLWNLILQKKLAMFTEKGCGNAIRESLKWETIEQTFFWKLFYAHGFKGDVWLQELLREVDFKKHPEATLQVFDALRDQMPREELFREVLRQDPDDADDHTFVTLVLQWTINMKPQDLAEGIAKMIAKVLGKKRAANKNSTPIKGDKGDLTVEHILGHIASIQSFVAATDRTGGNKRGRDGDLTQVLYNPNLEVALKKARDSVSQAVRDKFRDVFTLVTDGDDDDIEEIKVASPKKTKKNSDEKPGKKRNAAGKSAGGGSSSSSRSRHSSDEESETVTPTPKPKKHRNKSPPTVID